MPHSTVSKGNSSSAIANMEENDGFPPVIRLGSSELKITKSDFRNKLDEAFKKGYIV